MLRIATVVDPAVRALVEANLAVSNTERSPVMAALRVGGGDAEVLLDVYAFDGDDLVGGLTGSTWAQWLSIDLLWVQADRRGSGLGADLLRRAERIAVAERGCVGARLETWDFQARPFYERHGYVVFGTLEGYPPGATEFHMAKRLDD